MELIHMIAVLVQVLCGNARIQPNKDIATFLKTFNDKDVLVFSHLEITYHFEQDVLDLFKNDFHIDIVKHIHVRGWVNMSFVSIKNVGPIYNTLYGFDASSYNTGTKMEPHRFGDEKLKNSILSLTRVGNDSSKEGHIWIQFPINKNNSDNIKPNSNDIKSFTTLSTTSLKYDYSNKKSIPKNFSSPNFSTNYKLENVNITTASLTGKSMSNNPKSTTNIFQVPFTNDYIIYLQDDNNIKMVKLRLSLQSNGLKNVIQFEIIEQPGYFASSSFKIDEKDHYWFNRNFGVEYDLTSIVVEYCDESKVDKYNNNNIKMYLKSGGESIKSQILYQGFKKIYDHPTSYNMGVVMSKVYKKTLEQTMGI